MTGKIMTVGETPVGHNMVQYDTSIVSAANAGQQSEQKLVMVQIKYPDGYAGQRFFADGDIKEVAPETAQLFLEKGIAIEFKEGGNPEPVHEPAPEPVVEPTDTGSKADGDIKEVAPETAGNADPVKEPAPAPAPVEAETGKKKKSKNEDKQQ